MLRSSCTSATKMPWMRCCQQRYVSLDFDLCADKSVHKSLSQGGIEALKYANKTVGFVTAASGSTVLFLDVDPKAKHGRHVPTLNASWMGAKPVDIAGKSTEEVLALLDTLEPGHAAPSLVGPMPEMLVNVSVANFVLKGADLMAPGAVRVPAHVLQEIKAAQEAAAAPAAAAAAGSDDEEGDDEPKVHPVLRHVSPSLGMPDLQADDLVMVRTVGNPLPWCMAKLLMSTNDAHLNGMRGRLLQPVFVYRDELWTACGCTVPNDGFTQNQVSPVHVVDKVAAHVRQCILALSAAVTKARKEIEDGEWEKPSGAVAPTEAAADADDIQLAVLSAPEQLAATARAAEAACTAASKVAALVDLPEWEVWCVAGIKQVAVQPLLRAAAALVGGDYSASTPAEGEEGGGDDTNVVDEAGVGGSGVAATADSVTTLAAAGSGAGAAGGGEEAPWYMRQDKDDLVWNTLLQALKNSLKPKQLPILASTLWAGFILPARPKGTTLDVKGSKFKQVFTLLQQAEIEDILTLEAASEIDDALLEELGLQDAEDLDKILVITDVDRSAPALKAFKPWPAAATVAGTQKAEAAAEEEAAAAAAAGSSGAFARGIPTVEDMVKPLPDFMPVVDGARAAEEYVAANAKEGDAEVALPAMPEGTDVASMSKGKVRAFGTDIPTKNIAFRPQEIVLVLGRYVRAHKLYHPTDPSAVLLDDVLGKGLFKGASRRVLNDLGIEFSGNAKGYPDSISKAQLGKLAIQRCTPWHLLSYSNGDQVAARGAAPRIVAVRASVPNRKNKAATIIRGLEYFGVDPSAVASACATKFACSTTVQVEEGEEKTAKEVMMQGDCCERVPEFLVEKFKIPNKFIDVDDSGGPKKSKGGGGAKGGRGGKGGKKRR